MELHAIVKRTNDIIAGSSEAFVGTICEDGFPHVSQRSLINPSRLDEIYFSGANEGELCKRVRADDRVSLSFQDEKNNVTLIGRVEEIREPSKKRELWLDWFIHHYPGGPEGPKFVPLRFTTERLSLWVDQKSFHGEISEITTPASYCGLLCGSCDYSKSHNCPGCHTLQGKPFWGECPLAACSREKGLDHCGLCPDMPCDQLREFSCGEGAQCDKPKGSRLEVLSLWAKGK